MLGDNLKTIIARQHIEEQNKKYIKEKLEIELKKKKKEEISKYLDKVFNKFSGQIKNDKIPIHG